MTEKHEIGAEMVRLCRSIFERGLTGGGSGNVSARLNDGSFLVTPTGVSLGALEADRLAHLSPSGAHLGGDRPTKEWPLHAAFYDTRPGTGAVVHLHSTHATAWSMVEGVDPDNALPPITPYAIMRLGKVKLLPFFLPGSAEMGEAVAALGGKRAAVLLANHGPVVAAGSLGEAVNGMEELEETAKLALLLRGVPHRGLSPGEIAALVERFDVEWDG